MKIDENLDVIIKAPRRLSDEKILEFIKKHESWIEKQKRKITNEKELLSKYDFDNNIYIFGKPYRLEKGDKKDIYVQYFNNLVVELVENLSKQANIPYKSLKITSSVRIWGSMDRYNNMKLNMKLLVLPKNIVEYVILHELCHTKEFNHSKKFWKEVEKHCPNYKQLVKELKLYGGLLKQNIF